MRIGIGFGLCGTFVRNLHHDNYSVIFSGTNDHIVVDGVAGDMNTNIGTVSCWAKGVEESGSVTFFQAAYDTSNFYRLWWKDDDKDLKFTIKRGGTASHVAAAGAVVDDFQTDGNWYHLAATWNTTADGGSGELKLYINGTQQGGTQTIGGTFGANPLDKADIAKFATADGAYYNGSMNEVSIFTTVADVSLLYNGGNPVDLTGTAGLVGYWKLDEGTGTAAYDSSGKGNTGTLTNTPVWQTAVRL